MDYKVFYRKYRPKNFLELVGQDNIKDILINSIKYNKIAHAYIFTGPRGTGKTSTAKIFAKTLNCLNNSNGVSCDECEMCKTYNESADIIEIDAASNNGVEEIRTLRDSVKIAPYNSKYKVYIIDEVHMLSNSAWNAFLKTLEEPPSHVIFILATTEINKIPETVMSRCQRFDFTKIPENKMIEHLKNICEKENIEITENSLKEISKLSNGCLRDALSYLDKISKFNTEITTELIENNFGVLSESKLEKLYNSVKSNMVEEINRQIDDISNSGITPLNFINDYVNYLLSLIITKKVVDYKEIEFIKKNINTLNNIIGRFNSMINPFILIKIELITLNYFPGNNDVNISQSKVDVKSENEVKKHDSDNFHEDNDVKEDIEQKTKIQDIKSIRINNSFVDVSKIYKNEFISNWNNLIDNMKLLNDYTIMGYMEPSNVEVVSKTNVIFSFKNDSEAIIFNNNIDNIESKYNEMFKSDYKFVGLSIDEWNVEKKKFIENKNKKYEYLDENVIIKEETNESDSDIKDIADDLFGDSLVEIE